MPARGCLDVTYSDRSDCRQSLWVAVVTVVCLIQCPSGAAPYLEKLGLIFTEVLTHVPVLHLHDATHPKISSLALSNLELTLLLCTVSMALHRQFLQGYR